MNGEDIVVLLMGMFGLLVVVGFIILVFILFVMYLRRKSPEEKDAKGKYEAGLDFFENRQYDEAVKSFNQSLELRPDPVVEAKREFARGMKEFGEKKYGKAVESFKGSDELYPDERLEMMIQYTLALKLLQEKDGYNALEPLNNALGMIEGGGESHVLFEEKRGEIQKLIGETGKDIEHMEKLFKRAVKRYEQGDYKVAHRMFKEIDGIYPYNSKVKEYLVWSEEHVKEDNVLKVKHAVKTMDFSKVMEILSKGIGVSSIECPNCGGKIKLDSIPEKEMMISCPYCSTSIYAENLFNKYSKMLED
ncbi:MAG: hypothetical protein KAU03_01620 [Candidatus Altiarchaeales archaeon]|nr:hypothetical protein [Candidatus Altiarchaeales archaeon]